MPTGVFKGFHRFSRYFKAQSASQKQDVYKTKPQPSERIINEPKEIGFNFKLVLADSLYGESDNL